MKHALILLLLSLLFLVATCDLFEEDNPDESNDPQSELIGTWNYPWTPSEYQRVQYLVFQPSVAHYLSNSSMNLHSQTAQYYAINDQSITIGSNLYRYGAEDGGNSLWLSDHPGDTLFLERSDTEINPDQWLADLSLEVETPLPWRNTYWNGLVFNGEDFMIMVELESQLQLLEFSPQGDSLSIHPWQLPANVTYYNGNLWYHMDSMLRRVDPETWEETEFVELAESISSATSLAIDETTIWASVYGSIRRYDRATGELIDTLATPSRTMWSLALHQGRLFSVFGGLILEFDWDEGVVSKTYHLPDHTDNSFYGVASDGTYLYTLNIRSDGLDLVTLQIP